MFCCQMNFPMGDNKLVLYSHDVMQPMKMSLSMGSGDQWKMEKAVSLTEWRLHTSTAMWGLCSVICRHTMWRRLACWNRIQLLALHTQHQIHTASHTAYYMIYQYMRSSLHRTSQITDLLLYEIITVSHTCFIIMLALHTQHQIHTVSHTTWLIIISDHHCITHHYIYHHIKSCCVPCKTSHMVWYIPLHICWYWPLTTLPSAVTIDGDTHCHCFFISQTHHPQLKASGMLST